MAINSSIVAKFICMALISAAILAPTTEALTCGEVTNNLTPCIGYLRKTVTEVPTGCCSGIKSLNSAAQSPIDRQSACKCLKSAAGSITGIDLNLAAGLPGKCDVSVPYKISPSTNCDSVQ